ncbi:MAG: hypothetical protein V2J11_11510 [Desulfofustis sp.]|jgi:hypothetical protein|nr:hypothetical protein [Desulfofustis sp.]
MKHQLFVLIAALSAMLAAGCGRVPEPSAYVYSDQQKMQAGHHWDVLAADVAGEINTALILGDFLTTPVFVRQTCGDEDTPCRPAETSVFDEAFRDLLITNLVALGVPTSNTPTEDAIVVHYKAQPVYHHTQRLRTIRPGLLTSISAGIIVLRNAPWELAAMAMAGGIDALNAAYNSLDRFEVVITTSMIAKNTYLYRDTSIYYINTTDSWHYNTTTAPAQITLSTPGSAPPSNGQQPIGIVDEPNLTGAGAPAETTGI